MPFPSGGLITETNQQYYEGAQPFKSATGLANESFQTSFNTNLVFGSWDENSIEYSLNNFKIYTSATGLQGSFAEYLLPFTVKGNTIDINRR